MLGRIFRSIKNRAWHWRLKCIADRGQDVFNAMDGSSLKFALGKQIRGDNLYKYLCEIFNYPFEVIREEEDLGFRIILRYMEMNDSGYCQASHSEILFDNEYYVSLRLLGEITQDRLPESIGSDAHIGGIEIPSTSKARQRRDNLPPNQKRVVDELIQGGEINLLGEPMSLREAVQLISLSVALKKVE